jgi:hypothetical protein
VRTTQGAVYIGHFVHLEHSDGAEILGANPSTKPRMMSILAAHQMLGHKSEDSTWRAVKALGIIITTRGSMPVYEACALSKAKQKNVPKKSTSEPITRLFQCVHMDISQIKVLDEDQNKVTLSKTSWIICVDVFTGKKFSAFTATKKAFGENTVEWLTQLTKRGAHVEVLQMDPSGKNKAFAERIKQVDCAYLQPITCEFTPRDCQQFNFLAETAFLYLVACACAMMGGANKPVECQKMIAIETLKTITLLDGLVVVELNGIRDTSDGHCFGGNPKWASELRTFGEAAVVKEKKRDKTTDQYSLDRMSHCYRFWNPDKNSIIENLDAIFLNQMYFGRKDQTPMLEVEPEDEIVDAGDLLAKDEGSDSDDEPKPPVTKSVTFADTIDTKVESASADKAPASGTTSGAQSVPSTAS